ncbi:hypothetical protein Taro_053378, partial [Colocasia esculenta]|nr:hypothetical protein [Colocasia esculenta]
TCFWDSQLVSTHRWTVSTPLGQIYCVDTQTDCVDTTGFNYSDCFLGQSSSVDTQVDCVDTTAPPASSSSAGPSSSGPSSSAPSTLPSPTTFSSLQPPTPPSFITIIPEGACIQGHTIEDIKDDFKEIGQFRGEIAKLRTKNPINTPLQINFATLKMPNIVFLPKLHSLIMDSAVGTIIFERFARVMARISIQQDSLLAFHRFLFREYHRGNIKSDVLAPLLSECERLSPSDWEKHDNQSAQQLANLNSSLFNSGKPTISVEEFLDLKSINFVQDSFAIWVERYKVFVCLKKELKEHQIFYPISIDQFLQHASFGTSRSYKMSLGKDEYTNFLEAQRQLHIQRMVPVMGSSYTIAWGVFQLYFQEQELKAWP